jgi:hypothetical protein
MTIISMEKFNDHVMLSCLMLVYSVISLHFSLSFFLFSPPFFLFALFLPLSPISPPPQFRIYFYFLSYMALFTGILDFHTSLQK